MFKFLKNETERDTNTKINSFVNLGMFLIGLICNSLSIYVFSKKKMRTIKFNLYTLVLSILELIFCLILSLDNLYLFCHQNILLHEVSIYSTIIFDYVVHTIESCIDIITLILSIDRLYAICKPMKIKSFITQIHTKLLILVSLSFIIFIKILLSVFCYLTSFRFIYYCSILTPIFFNLIPTTGIFVVNSFLIKEIFKSYKNKPTEETIDVQISYEHNLSRGVSIIYQKNRNHTVSANRINQTAKISKKQKSHYVAIIISSFWLMFTTITYHMFDAYFLIKFSNLVDVEDNQNLKITQIFFSFLFNSTYCINFFFYYSFNSSFRQYTLNIFCKKT
jgi:hypothetical protein